MSLCACASLCPWRFFISWRNRSLPVSRGEHISVTHRGSNHFCWFITVNIWNIFFNGGQAQKHSNEKCEWKPESPHFARGTLQREQLQEGLVGFLWGTIEFFPIKEYKYRENYNSRVEIWQLYSILCIMHKMAFVNSVASFYKNAVKKN